MSVQWLRVEIDHQEGISEKLWRPDGEMIITRTGLDGFLGSLEPEERNQIVESLIGAHDEDGLQIFILR